MTIPCLLVACISQAPTITAMEFSPTGTHLAIASIDGRIAIMDVTTKRERVLRERGGPVNQVLYAEGNVLLSAGATETGAGEVRRWNIRSGTSLSLERCPTDSVRQVAVSPAFIAATGTLDADVCIWRYPSGDFVERLGLPITPKPFPTPWKEPRVEFAIHHLPLAPNGMVEESFADPIPSVRPCSAVAFHNGRLFVAWMGRFMLEMDPETQETFFGFPCLPAEDERARPVHFFREADGLGLLCPSMLTRLRKPQNVLHKRLPPSPMREAVPLPSGSLLLLLEDGTVHRGTGLDNMKPIPGMIGVRDIALAANGTWATTQGSTVTFHPPFKD